MAEKRVARMGLASVETTCLPLAGSEACQLCVDECNAAGYHAIEFMRVHPKLDGSGQPDRRLRLLRSGRPGRQMRRLRPVPDALPRRST